jgi:hypothetical protein
MKSFYCLSSNLTFRAARQAQCAGRGARFRCDPAGANFNSTAWLRFLPPQQFRHEIGAPPPMFVRNRCRAAAPAAAGRQHIASAAIVAAARCR